MKIPFIALILQGIPEQIAVATLAFVIANIPLDWKRIVSIGILLAFSSYVLRLFPITFGIHTIVIIGLLFILLIKIGKSNVNSALIASLISFLGLIIIETICISILLPVFGVTSEVLLTNTVVRVLISLPQVLVIFMLTFIVFKIKTRKEVK